MQLFTLNPNSHYMQPGAVAFIPGWIILFLTIIILLLAFPQVFKTKKDYPKQIISPLLLAFIIGSLMPIIDDLSAFIFGPPFAHHSFFHSIFGLIITYSLFRFLSTTEIAKYSFLGNLYHLFFNYYLDRTTLFFPFTYNEYGLTDLIGVSTYNLKAINYPLIFIALIIFLIKYLIAQKKKLPSE